MAQPNQLTIIDSETMRGVIAPSEVMSKKMLTDVIDFLELSNPQSMKETQMMVKDAKKDDQWISLDDVKNKLDGKKDAQ